MYNERGGKMKRNTWLSVLLKVVVVVFVLGVLHKNQLFVSFVKGVDVGYLTSFKSFGVQDIVNEPLHLVSTNDASTMLVHQVDTSSKTTLEDSPKANEDEQKEQKTTPKKRIYIYNTHQYEGYQSHTVMDGGRYLKALLEQKGYEVIFEENDFEAYKRKNNMDLTETYPTSKIFMEQALKTYGNFDLIIDFHRDAIGKEASTFTANNKSYAKLMMVVSMSSSNYKSVEANSEKIHQAVDAVQPGIMRSDFKRENVYYNQQYASKMVLIEVGGMDNTYEEVTNSLDVLAVAIDHCLKEGTIQ